MKQVFHQDPEYWPVPLGSGLLVEVYFKNIQTGKIQLLGGGLRNAPVAVVRAASPQLPKGLEELVLPDGTGSLGTEVLVSEPNLRYLEEAEYEACGFDVPEPEENDKGDLAFIHLERLIAHMEPTQQLPFSPFGSRVFFEYDYDEESREEVEVGESGLVVPEKAIAEDNQLATVTGIGHTVEEVTVGDRIIVKRHAEGVTYEDKTYNFVSHPSEIFGLLRKA